VNPKKEVQQLTFSKGVSKSVLQNKLLLLHYQYRWRSPKNIIITLLLNK